MTNFMKWMNREIATNLTNKLMFNFILVIIVIVAATMGPTLYLFSDTMQKMNEDQALQGVEGLNSIIEMYKQDAVRHGLVLADNVILANAIEEKDAGKIMKILLPTISEANLDFAAVMDHEGIVIAQINDFYNNDENLTSQLTIRQSLLGKAIGGIEVRHGMKLAIIAGIPVKNSQGKTVGVISTA